MARNATDLGTRRCAPSGRIPCLEFTLLILAREPARFRAALRRHARYCSDNKVSLEEATAVLGLLAMLEARRARTAAQALADLLDNGTLQAAVLLIFLQRVSPPPPCWGRPRVAVHQSASGHR